GRPGRPSGMGQASLGSSGGMTPARWIGLFIWLGPGGQNAPPAERYILTRIGSAFGWTAMWRLRGSPQWVQRSSRARRSASRSSRTARLIMSEVSTSGIGVLPDVAAEVAPGGVAVADRVARRADREGIPLAAA